MTPHIWELIPNKSFGPISLGESRSSVRSKLGKSEASSGLDFGEEDSFADASIYVSYGSKKTVSRVVLWSDAPPVSLEGVPISAMDARQVFNLCKDRGWPVSVKAQFGVEDADSWFLNQFGVAIMWRVENTIDWISLFAPGVYGSGPFTEVKDLPGWALDEA